MPSKRCCSGICAGIIKSATSCGSPLNIARICQLAEKRPGVLDELAAERAKQLDVEIAELEKQAEELAEKIKRASDDA